MEEKKFCIDCGKWRIPIESKTGGMWCPVCFPEAEKDWNKIRGAKYAHKMKMLKEVFCYEI